MDFDRDSARRVFDRIRGNARGFKAERLKAKYAPPEETPAEEATETPAEEATEDAMPQDGADAAVDAAALPSVDDVKAKMEGKGALDALKAQGEQNEALGDATMDENRAALDGLDDEKLQALLAQLK